MDEHRRDSGPLHSMGMLCRKTGLKSDRVRAWERRYNVVEPVRSGGGHRLYREEDVEKLLMLRRATETGHRIAQIAHLPLDELRELVDSEASVQELPTPRHLAQTPAMVSACLSAVQQLDADLLRDELRHALETMSPDAVLQQLMVPLVHDIGELWAEGGLKASHEHLGTAVLRTFVEELRASRPVPQGAPRLLVTTPAGERHELGALLAAATATNAGWLVTYLGPDLPAAEIAGAARQTGAQAIGLSVVCPGDEDRVRSELATLRRHIGDATGLILGGRAATAFEDTAAKLSAVIVEDLAGLRPALNRFH